jgi:hypothetical protein
MKRSTFPIRIAGLVGMIVLLVLIVVRPAGAVCLQGEPTPRPTPTAAPYFELDPTWGISGEVTEVIATGALWTPGVITLFWDDVDNAVEGTFLIRFDTPTDLPYASVGVHTVYAVQGDIEAEAFFELVQGEPTDTPTPPTPPTFTSTPSPTTTPTQTLTPTPSPTLRPVTPAVTISPIPPTRPPVTRAPTSTRTRTPVPGPATNTPLPTITLVPTMTPGPGTPSVTPLPTATPIGDIADTGAGWGMFILWGFVLAALLVAFRMLRLRGVTG